MKTILIIIAVFVIILGASVWFCALKQGCTLVSRDKLIILSDQQYISQGRVETLCAALPEDENSTCSYRIRQDDGEILYLRTKRGDLRMGEYVEFSGTPYVTELTISADEKDIRVLTR